MACGIAIVNSHAVTDVIAADRLITALQNEVFRTRAVVLVAHDRMFGPVYYGRAEIVRYLESIDLTTLPWTEYTVTTRAQREAL